jgi:hypothetical protein
MVGNIHMIFTNYDVYVPYHDPVNRYGMSVSQMIMCMFPSMTLLTVTEWNIHMIICENDIP